MNSPIQKSDLELRIRIAGKIEEEEEEEEEELGAVIEQTSAVNTLEILIEFKKDDKKNRKHLEVILNSFELSNFKIT